MQPCIFVLASTGSRQPRTTTMKGALWAYVVRLGLAWASCTFIAHYSAGALVSTVAPAISLVSEFIQPDIAINLSVSPDDGTVDIRTFLLRPIRLSNTVSLRGHSKLPKTSVDSNHIVVPVVIILTILLGLPSKSWFRKALWIAKGVVASLGLMILNAGVLVSGKIDILILEAYERAGLDKDQSSLIWTVILLETGISSALAIAVALLIYRLSKEASTLQLPRPVAL